MINMKDTKKEMTIEELEKELAEVTSKKQLITEQLEKKKQDEEDRRVAQLALDKEKRKKEVDEAYENYITLADAYARDYGSCSTVTSNTYSLNSILNDPWAWWL